MVKRISPLPTALPVGSEPDEFPKESLGDTYRAWEEHNKARRADKRVTADRLLTAAGVKYEWKNAGAHLIVHAPDGRVIDYWPGTSKWMVRGETDVRRGGVKNILDVCKARLPLPEPDDLPPTPTRDGLV